MKQLLLIFTLFCASYMTVNAQTNTWSGNADNNWSNVANWSLNAVPTASNDVVIPTGKTVNLNVAGTTKSIVVQGNSTLNISSNLSILNASSFATNVTVNWSSSSLIGGGTLTNNGTINLNTGGSRYISGGTTLTNNGTVTMPNAGYFYLYDTSVFNNSASGIFDIQSDAVLSYANATHSFNNAGLLKRTGSDGNAVFSTILNNTGTISVESGTLTLNSLDKTFNGGVYNVSSGSALILGIQINASNTLTGLLNGAMNWANNISVASTARFNFTGTTGVTWTSGSLIGGGTLTNSSKISLASAGSRYVSGGTTLTNNGTVTMPDTGYFYLYDTSVFNNAASGVFDIQSDAVLSYANSTHSFNNAGLLKRTGSDGNAVFSTILNNTGTISVESGTLTMNSLGKTFNGGVYNVSTDSSLILSTQVDVENTLTGLLNGAMNWTGNISVASSATFNFTGATGVWWTSGSLIGTGNLINEGIISMTTGGSRYISGDTTLTNNGTVTMPSAGYLYLYDTSVFYNTTDGVFDIQSDAVISYSSSAHNFNNAGVLKKTAGDGDAYFSSILNNTGTISVESGTLIMNSLGKTFSGGVYNVSTGSALILGIQINVSNTLTGVLNGAMNWANNVSVVSAATFNFTGTTGVTWTSGSLIGGGTLTNSNNISMDSNGSRYISGGTTLTNNGTVSMPSAGYFYLYDTSVFDNTDSGVFDIQSDAVLSYANSTHSFNNAGLLKKTAGDGDAVFSSILNNTGTISVESGTLTMASLGKTFNGGVYNVSSDSALVLGIQVDVTDELTGVLDGPMHWANNVSVASTATFNFSGDTGVTWTSGSLLGGGTLTNASDMSLETGGSRYISGVDTKLVNTGTILFPNAGYLYLYNNAVLDNQTSGVIDFQSDAIISYSGNAGFNIINSGLIKKTAGAGVTYIYPPVTNSGIIDASFGELEFVDGFNLVNTIDGIIKGTATIDLPATANFTNDGTFAPGGAPGTLNVLGNFKSASTSVLDVELFGLTAGSGYDVLAITGNAIFSGTVNVNLNFAPSLNDQFIVATTSGTITQCTLSPTTSTEFEGMVYTFSVLCQNDNQVVLKVTNVTLGIEDTQLSESSIQLYPNPVQSILTIKNIKNLELDNAQIMDITGKIITTFELKNMGLTKEISLETYSSGLYFIKINGLNSAITKRIVKQ